MSCAETWHLWVCDGCGESKRLSHGEWAEPAIPKGWLTAFGWRIHACSAKCRNAIQKKHGDAGGKLYLWVEWKEVA